MAKIKIERAYIEADEKEQDKFSIMIEIKRDREYILVGTVSLNNPKSWLYTMNNEDGDLVINNSAGMEAKKWDYITKEILGG
jgi:hypothetical protein